MKTKLNDIVTIQTGLFAKTVTEGIFIYLQAKHFDEVGHLTTAITPDLEGETISEKHILKEGDILFAAKGSKNFAAVFHDLESPAVASTSFFVMKLKSKNILPEYLAWFLNHPNTQSILKGFAKGTAMLSISKQVLEELEIPVPSIQKQKLVVEISELRNKERSIRLRIDQLKEHHLQQQIINAIN